MRYAAGCRARMRRAQSLLPPCRAALAAVRSAAGRAVLAWAVLAGLFFMHGATSLGGGCHGSEPVTMTSAMATGPHAVAVMPGAVTADRAGALTAARPAEAVAARQSGPPVPAGPGSAAAAVNSDPHHGGMLCSSRLTRQGIPSGPAAGPAVLAFAFLAGALLLLPGLAGASPRSRPPGRPGLPLPLFLGVSRT